MTHFRALAALTVAALLPACTDYATFVTATNIGISADTTTQDVNIGYTRTELFTGPGYPEQGEAPRAVGYINSDLHPFAPHIQQLYATGDAADLVTLPTKPTWPPSTTQPPPAPPYYGQRRALVFGTGSDVGLHIKFSAGTTPAPSSIKFGYNREELSIIPMQSQVPADKDHPDKYAPVLASMNMNLGGDSSANAGSGLTTPGGTNLGIKQFFATGSAARNLAATDDEIRDTFKAQAKDAVKSAASLSGNYSYDDASKKIEAFWRPAGKLSRDNEVNILRCMTKNEIGGDVWYLVNGPNQADRNAVVTCLQL